MADRSYQSIHVLVAEDENFQRLALIDILTLCDYQVTAVENGRLARDELLKADNNIDIVLLDLYMPEMDGIELLLLMQDHEHLKRIPVIMMSTDNESDKVAYCIANGAKDYLVKPLRIQNVKGIAKYVEYNPNGQNTSGNGGVVGLQSYKIIRMIGQGAGGSVELVQKRSDGQLFALKTISMKFMDDQQKKMAQQEITLLKVLVAPSIIRYYESFVENDSIHIIMEYAKEGALSDKITEHKQKGLPIDEDTILYFTAQIIISVLFMHSKNILHRDIKTQNLFLTKENIVKLGDFGISKELGTNANAKTLVGTPYFMSPEVCSGENYGQKADIWAIGCTLYEMVMLKRPFDNDNLNILFNKIRFEPPPPLHENISTEIRMLITFMLQKDPVKRPSVWDLSKIPIISKNIRKYYEEEAQDDPFLKEYIFSGPRINPSRNDNKKEEKKNSNENNQKNQDSSNANEEMFKALSSALPPYDYKMSMFKIERNVIDGKQIFSWVQQNYPNYNTSQIVEMLNELVEKKYLHHIGGPLHQSDQNSLYRFQFDMPGIAANLSRVWNKSARPALQCLQGIIETANEVLNEVTDKLEGKVFDDKLYQNKKYSRFVELVCELQKIYLQDINEQERKCIFINLLQIMYFHKFMRVRYMKMRSDKKQQVKTLLETLASFLPFLSKGEEEFYYAIGNLQFTLDDIKHGIIRGNKTHKLSSFKPFGPNDNRKQFVLTPDLRVLMLFKEENVIPTELKFIKLETMDQQLNEICNKFLSTYVYIDNIENDLTMHKIFQLYQSDFGPEIEDGIVWASNYTKNLGRIDDLVQNIKSGDIFVQFQEKFES